VDPDIDETAALELGKREKYDLAGVFGNLADDFGHRSPPVASSVGSLMGIDFAYLIDLVNPFLDATI